MRELTDLQRAELFSLCKHLNDNPDKVIAQLTSALTDYRKMSFDLENTRAQVELMRNELKKANNLAKILLSTVDLFCEHLHHNKSDHHGIGVTCPVEIKLAKAIKEYEGTK